jgi:hypothetical protein
MAPSCRQRSSSDSKDGSILLCSLLHNSVSSLKRQKRWNSIEKYKIGTRPKTLDIDHRKTHQEQYRLCCCSCWVRKVVHRMKAVLSSPSVSKLHVISSTSLQSSLDICGINKYKAKSVAFRKYTHPLTFSTFCCVTAWILNWDVSLAYTQ